MIRNYLNDDEDDENNEDDCIEFSKPTKKVQKSRDSSFSTDDSAQELPTDAIPSDFFFFDSNKQTKIPWASVLPLLKEKDLISCVSLLLCFKPDVFFFSLAKPDFKFISLRENEK